jgi:STE24 endopeptidase
MHIYVVIAFAMVFWHAEGAAAPSLVPHGDMAWTLCVVLLQPPVIAVSGRLLARRVIRLLGQGREATQVQLVYHRGQFVLRLISILGFAATMLLTRWPHWFALAGIHPALQILGDLAVLSAFFASVVALWLGVFPVEQRLRSGVPAFGEPSTLRASRSSLLRSYLDFHIRHHLLTVAVPMVLILFAANILRAYERPLYRWTQVVWAADVLLGAAALAVFVVSPAMLRRIWRTAPLERGELRDQLEQLCRRIGLRVHEILVWHSDGLMINAAVMGVVPRLRCVLLSDALLATMSTAQIEAVFGHEAGHVRRYHIPLFLIFAFVGWLMVTGLMELLATAAIHGSPWPAVSALTVQGVGIGATVVLWAVGFGWLSRRFEREADLFGARCVTPEAGGCYLPCSVHLDADARPSLKGRVCATGAAVFASALDRVAVLNGIPHEERSWRHSSIRSRIRFLASLSGDPNRVARFERVVRRAKQALVASAILGTVTALLYLRAVPRPAILRLPLAGSRP